MNTNNNVEKNKTPLKTILIIGFALLTSACATTDINSLSATDQEISQHELFGVNIHSNDITAEKLKAERSGTSFDIANHKNLTQKQLSDMRKRDFIARSEMALNAGNTDYALYSYMKALLEDNADIQLYYKIGQLHEAKNNPSLAALAYQRALSINPMFINALERLGRLKLNNREYDEARSLFDQAVAFDMERIKDTNDFLGTDDSYDIYSPYHAYIGLGVINDLNNNHASAIMNFGKAIKIKPNSASAENNLGYSFYLQNDLDEALHHFKRAIIKDKNYSKAWSNLALVYVRKEQYSEAVSVLVDHNNDQPSAYNTVGYLCMLDGKYDQAEQLFNKAIDLSPVFFEIAVENRDLNRRRHSESVYQRLN